MTEKTDIRTTGDHVVVLVDEKAKVTSGGLHIPATASENKAQTGVVMAVGRGILLDTGEIIPLEVKVGDHIIFADYAGTKVTIDFVEYLVMRESDILAVILS